MIGHEERLFSKGLTWILQKLSASNKAGKCISELLLQGIANRDIELEQEGRLDTSLPQFSWLVEDFANKSCVIQREVPFKNNQRIDLLASSASNKYIVGIELKVTSTDSKNQINSYINHLITKTKYIKNSKSYPFVLLFVTLDGTMPENVSQEKRRFVLPVSWSDICKITKPYLNKKEFTEDKQTISDFLQYIETYPYISIGKQLFDWLLENITNIHSQWDALNKLKGAENIDMLASLSQTILDVTTDLTGYIAQTLAAPKNLDIQMDELLPKTSVYSYRSYPIFYASDWLVKAHDQEIAQYYYMFSSDDEPRPAPPQALANLINRTYKKYTPCIYFISKDKSLKTKELHAYITKNYPKYACTSEDTHSQFSWEKSVTFLAKIPYKPLTKEELSLFPFTELKILPKRSDQLDQLWDFHKAIHKVICKLSRE